MFYSHGQLDRADHLRKSETTQAELFNAQDAKVLPVWRGKSLVGENNEGEPHMLTLPARTAASDEHQKIFLGLIDNVPLFAISVSKTEESSLGEWTAIADSHHTRSRKIRFDDLRVVGPALPAADGALMAYARGMVYWHDTSRFCSRCGGELHSVNAGHIKRCNTDTCNHHSFPRTDPAVIMLIKRPATSESPALCLLGRNKNWPPGVVSTLAGFVENGESLEHAVQREVYEEANITTENVQYIASQPWPFPRSIMLGFEATATSSEITCDPDELDDAQWFTAEQLKQFGTWGDERYEFQLPRTDSIARFLIDRWVSQQQEE